MLDQHYIDNSEDILTSFDGNINSDNMVHLPDFNNSDYVDENTSPVGAST